MKRSLRLKGKKVQATPPAPIRISFGSQAFQVVAPDNKLFFLSLQGTLRYFLVYFGIRLPEMEFRMDSELQESAYMLEVFGTKEGHGELRPGRILALGEDEHLGPLLGEPGRDPIYGLPARWIVPAHAEAALEFGCHLLEPETVLATHLMERLVAFLPRFLQLEDVLAKMEHLTPRLQKKATTHLGGGRILKVLRELLRERVGVSEFSQILEACVGVKDRNDLDELVQAARKALSPTLCSAYLTEDGRLPSLVLADWVSRRWEKEFDRETAVDGWFAQLFMQQLEAELEYAMEQSVKPVLVVDSKLRRDLFLLLERTHPDLPVLSWAELPREVEVEEMAVIGSRMHPSVGSWQREVYRIDIHEKVHF